jgi:hypothetical protein
MVFVGRSDGLAYCMHSLAIASLAKLTLHSFQCVSFCSAKDTIFQSSLRDADVDFTICVHLSTRSPIHIRVDYLQATRLTR